MGKLVVNMFATLDGVIQSPGAPKEDTEDGFRFGGWQQPFLDEKGLETVTRNIDRSDALLLGRKTYDIFESYWPKQPDTEPIAKKFNSVPKYVASRNAKKKLSWDKASLIQGELGREIPRIKKTHREIHTWGSASLIPTLLQHNLVDRFDLWVYPVVLGTGKRLFPEGTVASAFRLTETEAFPKGAIHAIYEPAGKPVFGTVGEQTTHAH